MKRLITMISLAVCVIYTPAMAGDVEISGEIRVRPEMKNNYDFNAKTSDNKEFTGQRTRVNFKTGGDDAMGFVQLQDSRYWGQSNGFDLQTGTSQPNSVSDGREGEAVDIHQAYFQVNNLAGLPVSLKAGRQELVYGSQRLLGHLGWQDNARAHDAYKLMVNLGDLGQVDVIKAKQDENNVSGNSTSDVDLDGLYAMLKVAGLNLDAYFLRWQTEMTDAGAPDADTGIQYSGGRNVSTMGVRVAGKAGPADYTIEYALQGGDWGVSADGSKIVAQDASAMSIAAGFAPMEGTRAGIEYNTGSGDAKDSADTHGTFVFPNHTNHAHYGHMDFFSWGNMNDIAVKLETKQMGMTIKFDYHMLSLAQATDDWLNVVGTGALMPAKCFDANDDPIAECKETDAGSEIDITVAKGLTESTKLVVGYSMFTPGAAVKERKGSKAVDGADWGYAMFIYNF
ncbi:MAG: alginate export family protein [Nitrospinota bacterium]|nr:alginate export family protein [Nitrospinota bacterium]